MIKGFYLFIYEFLSGNMCNNNLDTTKDNAFSSSLQTFRLRLLFYIYILHLQVIFNLKLSAVHTGNQSVPQGKINQPY